jgi:hypothetical protein
VFNVLEYRKRLAMYLFSSLGNRLGHLPTIQVDASERVGLTSFIAREFVGFIGGPESRSDGQSTGSMYEVKVLDKSERMEFVQR